MSFFSRARTACFLASSALAFVACGDDDDGGSPAATAGSAGQAQGGEPAGAGGAPAVVASGEAQCRVLGELCHEADTGSGPAHECHELGHVNDAAACVEGFSGCVETCVEGSAGEEPLCAALGELCHAVDDETGPLHECHELGHVNDAAVCAAEFDRCAELCLAAREELEHGHGAGGAGGAGAGAGGAHSHAEGGAH